MRADSFSEIEMAHQRRSLMSLPKHSTRWPKNELWYVRDFALSPLKSSDKKYFRDL
jgi:hypothetical protein